MMAIPELGRIRVKGRLLEFVTGIHFEDR